MDSSITNVAWLWNVGLIFKDIIKPNKPKRIGRIKSILLYFKKELIIIQSYNKNLKISGFVNHNKVLKSFNKNYFRLIPYKILSKLNLKT